VTLEHRAVIEEGHDVGIGVDDMGVGARVTGGDGAEGAGSNHEARSL
jgi:hypothetical protein